LNDSIINWLVFFQHELLLFSAVWFLIGAIDDLCVDGIWIVRHFYRKIRYYRKQKPLTVAQLPAPEHAGKLAIFVATWREAAVIGTMLGICHARWSKHSNHLIYVGCYPNDDVGLDVISRMAKRNPNIRPVICANPGPTTKADCLNNLWRAMVHDEDAGNYKIKAVILHDAEDVVHADELRIYDRLIETKMAVQLPVIPVRVPGSRWVSGHYCDEFAEAHGKTLIVREALGAALPLAGVGCAIRRDVLENIAAGSAAGPFDAASLTEDYELGLKIGEMGGEVILARMLDSKGELVGTRACFPHTIDSAARQKARWLCGIALNGWDRIGWRGSMRELWMLLRDRKVVFSSLVLLTAYTCIILSAILAGAHIFGYRPSIQISDSLLTLLTINGFLLTWHLVVRAFLVWRLYGLSEALFSIPRLAVANIIAIVAVRKAIFRYIRHCFGGALKWGKTEHSHIPAVID
jgi:bacteriophage N4 adsorption protein B